MTLTASERARLRALLRGAHDELGDDDPQLEALVEAGLLERDAWDRGKGSRDERVLLTPAGSVELARLRARLG